MLWLIQRDFLEGSSVQQMVNTALETVDNPRHDADIEEVHPPPSPPPSSKPRTRLQDLMFQEHAPTTTSLHAPPPPKQACPPRCTLLMPSSLFWEECIVVYFSPD